MAPKKTPPSLEQRDLMTTFLGTSGFEFMCKDEVSESDPSGFVRLWARNIRWLRDAVDSLDRMIDDYRNRHEI